MITTDWLTTTTLASVAAFQDVKTLQASTAITAVTTLLSGMEDGAIASVDLSNPTCPPVKSKINLKTFSQVLFQCRNIYIQDNSMQF